MTERTMTAEHLGEVVAGMSSATGLRPETILALVTDLGDLPSFLEVFQGVIASVAKARGVEVKFDRFFQATGHTAMQIGRDGGQPGGRS
jgi:hypothetical protein